MKLIFDNQEIPDDCTAGVVAIGNFDGVHRGHQQLLNVAKTRANELGCPWGLVTFEPHPRQVFRPEEPVFRLTPMALKARLAAGLGAKFTSIIKFDRDLAAMEPEDFVGVYLQERLKLQHVVTGYDFHFGRGRKGSPGTMREIGARSGFGVTVVEQVTDDDGLAPFSSSTIRSALRHGRVGDAAHQLGYYWTVTGAVVKGDQRGRTIGFPTANIVLDSGCEPADGIYAVRVHRRDEVLFGAAYIGRRPTFDTDRRFLEVFLLDFDGDLYGQTLDVEFIDRIRGDRKFPSVDELTAQMNQDCVAAARILSGLQYNDPIAEFPLGNLQSRGQL